jgi:ubiquinone/menaquinone biosynthesis C-methylase UbiE
MQRADYGVDAPGVIRNFSILGGGMMVSSHWLPGALKPVALWWGLSWVLTSLAMVAYARVGKFRHRNRILGLASWRGDERVLDVGTGRGLLMIGAALRLSDGKSVGIDIWNPEDLTGNRPEQTRENARLEGVAARIEVRTEDARSMSFPDASFDTVLSNLALHNIYDAEGRDQACREIARVLKPRGRALISDFRHTGQYAAAFAAAGLTLKMHGPYLLDTFPPLRIVEAIKN